MAAWHNLLTRHANQPPQSAKENGLGLFRRNSTLSRALHHHGETGPAQDGSNLINDAWDREI